MANLSTQPRPGRRPGSSVPKDETPVDRFKRLATGRTNKALDGLQGLTQLANPATYEYTDQQITAIFDAIRTEMDAAEKALRDRKLPSKQAFQL